MTVAKIITCILIASHLVSLAEAAPFADNHSSQLPGSSENRLNHRKSSENRKVGFSNTDVQMWTNPCNADSMIESNISVVEPSASYENIKLLVAEIDLALKENDKINTTNYAKDWDVYNGENYEFLPQKPTGNHRQWHFDMQKFVASFIILHKHQVNDDKMHNNNSMSEELYRILKDAQHLLCEIEHFVNATSSQKIGSKDWIKKKEMREIVQYKNITAMFLNRIYAKGRFQDYIQKLLKRIEQQSERNYVERQITYPKLKSMRKKKQGTRKARKGNRRNQNGRRSELQYEATPTKRVHIVRTSKTPTQPRSNNINKNSNNINNKNKNNRRRQRTRTTTMTTTTVAPA